MEQKKLRLEGRKDDLKSADADDQLHLPASLLEESKLQRRPLQHGEGRDCDRPARLAGEAAL